jgi:uncharacterized membrane protein YgdD (TMEM256/DUF423 family)
MSPRGDTSTRLAVGGALVGMVSVIAGAFGAHALAPRLDAHAMEVWRTGAHYALVHAVAIVALAVRGIAPAAAALWLAGSVVFAGTLWAIALGAPRVLGAVTPIGGLMLILGWLALAWALARRKP